LTNFQNSFTFTGRLKLQDWTKTDKVARSKTLSLHHRATYLELEGHDLIILHLIAVYSFVFECVILSTMFGFGVCLELYLLHETASLYLMTSCSCTNGRRCRSSTSAVRQSADWLDRLIRI